jgi:curved DNA-binding protein CbpA
MKMFKKINIGLMLVICFRQQLCAEPEFRLLRNTNEYSHTDYQTALKNLGLDFAKKNEQAEIRNQYKRLSLIHHPDKGGKEENFKILQGSYEYLTDENHQKKYASEQASKPGEEVGLGRRQEQKTKFRPQQEETKQTAEQNRQAAQEQKNKEAEIRKQARKDAQAQREMYAQFENDRIRMVQENFLAMSYEDIAKTSDIKNIKYLTPDTIRQITTDPIKLKLILENEKFVEALTPEQVKAIPADQLAKEIRGTVGSKLGNLLLQGFKKIRWLQTKANQPIKNLPDSFVDALSPQQAQAIIEQCDGRLEGRTTHLVDYFSLSQIEKLRQLAEKPSSSEKNNNSAVKITNLMRNIFTYIDPVFDQNPAADKDEKIKQEFESLNSEEFKKFAQEFYNKYELEDAQKNNDLKVYLNRKISEKVNKIFFDGPEKLTPSLIVFVNITKLTIEQIKNLTVEEIKYLSPSQIQALSSNEAQAQALSEEQIQELSDEQIKYIDLSYLSKKQIEFLLSDQIKALQYFELEKRVQDFLPYQIGALSEKQIDALLPYLNRLSGDQIKALQPMYIQKIYPSIIQQFSVEQIKALTREQIQALVKPQIQALTRQQIQALTPDQMRALTLNQMEFFTPDQIKAFTKDQTNGLSGEKQQFFYD